MREITKAEMLVQLDGDIREARIHSLSSPITSGVRKRWEVRLDCLCAMRPLIESAPDPEDVNAPFTEKETSLMPVTDSISMLEEHTASIRRGMEEAGRGEIYGRYLDSDVKRLMEAAKHVVFIYDNGASIALYNLRAALAPFVKEEK